MLLDAGCGDGELTRRIVEAMHGVSRLVLVDIESTALDEARDQFIGLAERLNLGLQCADVTVLPYADGFFDTVLLNDVLHHTRNPAAVVAECARVLAPAGLLVLSEMVCDGLSRAEIVGRDLHHLKSAIDRLHGVSHGPTLPRSTIRAAVSAAGLALEWQQLERFAAADPDDRGGRRELAAHEEFLQAYLQHADGLPEYASLRKQAAFLSYRMRREGFAPEPELRLLARKTDAPGRSG